MQEVPQPQQVPESYIESHAFQNAMSEFLAKQYRIPEASEKEFIDCRNKFYELWEELDKNVAYHEELFQLKQRFSDMASLEFIEAYEKLRARFSPELIEIEKKLVSLSPKDSLCDASEQIGDEDQRRMMQQEYAIAFQKYSNIGDDLQELLKNPDYQSEVQLATEKYNCTKNMEEYLAAIKDIQCKYLPEMRALNDELKAISQKYNNL